jgi:hypothetical protein
VDRRAFVNKCTSCSLDILGKQKRGEILKILSVPKFFADVENVIRVMTAGNGAIVRPGP